MIKKTFEIKNFNVQNKIWFFHGENQGQKEEVINEIFLKNFDGSTFKYSEKEVLNDLENFYNEILTESFFEKKKLIIISQVSDKIKNEIETLLEKKLKDITIILMGSIFEKKSKLRNLFEKDKQLISVPFYHDNNQTLSNIASIFFRKKKIQVSQQAINLLVERSSGDRKNLLNELNKIESFTKNGKKITLETLFKITSLAENYDISELTDNCLAKNKKRTIHILNENNFTNEESILILRILLSKAKRLMKLTNDKKNISNIDQLISSFRPPIFWKDKDLVKKQIQKWSDDSIENLIYEINQTELLIKKNYNNSLNILHDFILNKASEINN